MGREGVHKETRLSRTEGFGGPCPDSRMASSGVCRNESEGGKRRKKAFAEGGDDVRTGKMRWRCQLREGQKVADRTSLGQLP